MQDKLEKLIHEISGGQYKLQPIFIQFKIKLSEKKYPITVSMN